MRNNARVRKIYSELFYKNKYDTPYFIEFDHEREKGYFVYKIRNDNKKFFKTLVEAKEYIYSTNYNPLIIVIDFHNKKR